MKDKALTTLMDAMEKCKRKFDEALENGQTFEASSYGHELTEMAKAILEHHRAEYEAKALEQLMKKGGNEHEAKADEHTEAV